MTNEHMPDEPHAEDNLAVMPRPIYAFERKSVQAVDQAAIEEYHIPGLILMENAARCVADEILCLEAERDTNHPNRPVLILCGKGNNGADGLALARHLHNEGFSVTIALAFKCTPDIGTVELQTHLRIVDAMNLPIHQIDDEEPEDALNEILHEMGVDNQSAPRIIVDALLGTGLCKPPRAPFERIIKWINGHNPHENSSVVAVDVPSGLDCDKGIPLGAAAVRAELTVTFVGLKKGFLQATAQPYLGDLALGNIGVPVELLERFGRILTAQDVFDDPDKE